MIHILRKAIPGFIIERQKNKSVLEFTTEEEEKKNNKRNMFIPATKSLIGQSLSMLSCATRLWEGRQRTVFKFKRAVTKFRRVVVEFKMAVAGFKRAVTTVTKLKRAATKLRIAVT